MENKNEKENYLSSKEKSKSSSYIDSEKLNEEEQSSGILQFIPKLNKVKNRFLFLSPTVRAGLERECNRNDFYREGDNYIGKGAFGEVWKVSHKMTGKIYVIKVMDKSSIKGEKLIDQINREIEIMYKLNHPHIIKLINHFEDDEKLYLLMPYASKGQLYSLLKRQVRFDQRTAAQYMREVIEAVRYIHSFSPKIIHRDIKPENLLLDDNYRVLLSDFGWSNFLDDNEFRKTFCGTPEYLSPEMAKKSGHNEMVDIWALGVLMFEFLAGYAPFSGSTPKELYSNIKKLKIHWPDDFPPLAKNLITKILKLNPSERLNINEILDHAWFTQNPPLRHVLTNYLTNEKDILKSHLIIEKPENVEDKLNEIVNANKKRKFGTLRHNSESNNSDKDDKSINSDKNEDEIINTENKEDDIDIINNNDKINDNNSIKMANINENFILVKKEKKILEKKYEELLNKEQQENKMIKLLKEENEKLKNKQENLKDNYMILIDQEIKKYKLLSEDREKLIKEIDELNLNNNELNLQNEFLKNKVIYYEREIKYLNTKINELTKENQKYILDIGQINNNDKILNIDSDNNDKLIEKLNEISEKNIKILKDDISPMNLDLTNFGSKIDDLVNSKVLSFLDDKMKYLDNIIKEENNIIKKNENKDTFLEEKKKLIEEIKQEKMKNELKNNNYDKLKEMVNKNNILEERIQSLIEEKKSSNELIDLKSKELKKAYLKIKNMEDKLYDISEFIKNKCKNEAFIKKIISLCNIENFK